MLVPSSCSLDISADERMFGLVVVCQSRQRQSLLRPFEAVSNGRNSSPHSAVLVAMIVMAHGTSLTNRIPPEIWSQIFMDACTDTGTTGRSLSCVSQLFRSLSQPVKYQSIALGGFRQVLAFASILKSTPLHLIKLKYIYIARIQPGPHDTIQIPTFRQKLLSDAFKTILTVVSSTVEILHLDIDNFETYTHHSMPLPYFPRLWELQSDNFFLCRYMVMDHDGGHIYETDPHFPVLDYWNITFERFMLDCPGVLACIPTVAPSLSHLRVVGNIGPLHRDLSRALATGSQCNQGEISIPPSIKKIYMKPLTKPLNLRSPGNILHERFVQGLKQLNELGDARFVLLLPYHLGEERYTVEEWLERVNGGGGCWSLRDRVPPSKQGRPGIGDNGLQDQ